MRCSSLVAQGKLCTTLHLATIVVEVALTGGLVDTRDNVISMEYTSSDENKTTSSFYMDHNSTNENWKYVGSQLNNDFESVESQSEISGKIRIVLYVLGSLLVILSKIRYRDES